jgi:hypothetical protein
VRETGAITKTAAMAAAATKAIIELVTELLIPLSFFI